MCFYPLPGSHEGAALNKVRTGLVTSILEASAGSEGNGCGRKSVFLNGSV
ncbi:hypothetical protein FTUN_8798 [Frigoriglobus tundricola]|uniref:Uncharacterized protein n=1 Tax=Frigoriglobus tundricola TaxID=2774151 RepID=A0A6M5Z4K5_9BACT|nr:hypothetical protein FTUN_8798 [Frigoriglobus tundricola]